MKGIIELIARIMLALIFVLAAVGKIMDPVGTTDYMQVMGVSTILFWPTVALELLGGIAIAIGYHTRLAASALAIFSIVTAVLFHSDLQDKMQMILFLKNIAMAGGLLLLATGKTTALSIDSKKEKTNFFATKQ